MAFFEDLLKNEIDLQPGAIKIDCPVRMIFSEKVSYFTPSI